MATYRRVYFLRHVALSFKVLLRPVLSPAVPETRNPSDDPLYPDPSLAPSAFSRMRRKWDACSMAFYASDVYFSLPRPSSRSTCYSLQG